MKALLSLITLAAISLGSFASNEKEEPKKVVEIKPVIYSDAQIGDYERILEIDSIQTSLENEKAVLLSHFKFTSKTGIERPINY